jgi:hypothetical protein
MNSSTPKLPSEYFPLAVGNSWIYEYQGIPRTPQKIEVRILSTREIQGKQYFEFSRWFTLTPGESKPMWIAWQDGSLYFWNGSEEKIIAGPILEDSSLIHSKEPMITPAGTFNDLMILRTCLSCADAGSTFTFARGTGVVSVSFLAIWGHASYELQETKKSAENNAEPAL